MSNINRIDKRFQDLMGKDVPAFIPFITAGDPDLRMTMDLILEFEKRGADIIELGFPFSDPIADGPVIQASYHRALMNGTKVSAILDAIGNLRKRTEIPIVAMVSYSTVFRKGCGAFIECLSDVGVDGVTIPDLPIDEEDNLSEHAEKNNFKIVHFIAPTTPKYRMQLIAQKSQGFIYYISVVGITGARDRLPEDIAQNIGMLKQITTTPIAVGFGVSTPEQVGMIGKIADGIIVGSAIIKAIEKFRNESPGRIVECTGQFVEELIRGAKGLVCRIASKG